MRSSRAALLLRAAFTCSVVLSTWSAALSSSLCWWSEVHEPSGELHHTFFMTSGSSVRLYHSVWSADRALLRCVWSDDATVTRSYASMCVQRGEFSGDADEHARSLFVAREGQCVEVKRGQRSTVRHGARDKRSFIVPGTLWCGSGNEAPSYQDLGLFSATDSCCREHDHCLHTILSFHSQYGVFNTNIFTMSHCDCDNRFHVCLKEANDGISDVVGYTFFNLLKMNCFTFSHQLQCTRRNWFGLCKEKEMALYAEVHPPTLYETTNSTLDNATDSDPQFYSNATTPPLFPGTINDLKATSFNATPSNATSSNARPSNATSSNATPSNDTSSNATLPNATPYNAMSERLETTVGTEQEARVTDDGSSCDVFKDLDQCTDRILPQQRKHGLFNADTTTVFHCNCSHRLFQSVAHQTLTPVHALLLGHVSTSCFLPQDCSENHTCSALLVKPQLSQWDWMDRDAGLDQQQQQQQRPPVVRRMRTKRKRNPRVVKLYKLCVRLSRRTHTNTHIKHRAARLQTGNTHTLPRPL